MRKICALSNTYFQFPQKHLAMLHFSIIQVILLCVAAACGKVFLRSCYVGRLATSRVLVLGVLFNVRELKIITHT